MRPKARCPLLKTAGAMRPDKEWRFDYGCGFEDDKLPADLELGIFNVAMAMYERNENDMKKASLKMGRRYGLQRALVA